MSKNPKIHSCIFLRKPCFFISLAKHSFQFVLIVKEEQEHVMIVSKKMEGIIMSPTAYEKRRISEFDSYCKHVLRNEAKDIQRQLARKRKVEISFSDLSEMDLNQLYVFDEYKTDKHFFHVINEQVALQSNHLSRALKKLSDTKQKVILLSYFLEMTDQEIGEALNVARSTIQYRRSAALKELKAEMEEHEHE